MTRDCVGGRRIEEMFEQVGGMTLIALARTPCTHSSAVTLRSHCPYVPRCSGSCTFPFPLHCGTAQVHRNAWRRRCTEGQGSKGTRRQLLCTLGKHARPSPLPLLCVSPCPSCGPCGRLLCGVSAPQARQDREGHCACPPQWGHTHTHNEAMHKGSAHHAPLPRPSVPHCAASPPRLSLWPAASRSRDRPQDGAGPRGKIKKRTHA